MKFVHRDLKPLNIMVDFPNQPRDLSEEAREKIYKDIDLLSPETGKLPYTLKLADFGSAK